jgi:large repetitive protein
MRTAERVRHSCARACGDMTLRTSGDLRNTTGLRHRRFSLVAVLAGTALLLTTFAGASGAGISAYQGTLYLAGPASTISGSYQLTTAAPGGQGTTPAAVQGVVGSGGLATGAYRWIYVTSSSGALTASVTSNQLSVSSPGNTPVLVSNVPVGADVYRATIPSGTSTGKYTYVGTNAGPTTTYTDTNASTAGAVLPEADTRVALSATGYMPFVPGVGPGIGTTALTSSSPPSIPSACTGWSVDSSAGFTFPAGTWTINAQVRLDAAGTGAATLTAAVWKVDASGNAIGGGTIVPPTDSAALALNGMSQTATVSYTTSAPTTLDSNERLCVQFWRHQTTGTVAGGNTTRTMWLLAYDPNNQISVHPSPNDFAHAALSSPADGIHTQSIPTLAATYSDTEGDPGNITLQLCSDSGCTSSLQTSGAISANNGDTKTWTPAGPLADGTYYWSARAQDTLGLPSAWVTSRSFALDTTAPVTTINSSPAASSNAPSGTFGFSANEGVAGFQCRVDGGAFSACSSPFAYGPLADGPHTFDVKATADLAGNAGGATSYAWSIDTVPPDTSIASNPAVLSNTASPSFSFTATEPGSTFECSLDGAGFASCSSPMTYSGVADGVHTFQVRAVDPAGNVDPSAAAYSWTIDATPPDTSIGPSQPAPLTTATGATFDFSSTETGSTFECSLDGAAFTTCSTPKTYFGLAEGNHTFQARAIDNAGNTDPTPASYSWTIDTTPPVTTIGPTTPPANTSSVNATFDLGSNEPGSTFKCSIDGFPFVPCTTPRTYSGLADGAHTFAVRASDPLGNTDASPATYFWSIDNVAPTTPTLISPSDGTVLNSIPQLDGSYDDATSGGDTGTIDFQLCSSSAPAGTACAPLVQSASVVSIASGTTASWTPAALADGTYHWQARATDAAGNQSGWSATSSFRLDTSVPVVSVVQPKDGAWVPRIELKGTFSKPSFAGTGWLEFRLCSDGLCLGVVSSGTTGTIVNGGSDVWSPATQPADGLWYWQVRSHDSAGNTSPWSPTRTLHLDHVAPGQPVHFNGQVAGDGLTLRWEAPNDTVANYVVFVNGAPWKNLGSTEYEVKMGPFDASDGRTFSVVAVDLAGNIGAMSPVLVGVPDLGGMTWAQALAAASARGLDLKRDVAAFPGVSMVVSSQDPPAASLITRGTAVSVSMKAAAGAPLAVRVSPGRISCKRNCVLKLRVELSTPAVVRSSLVNARGRVLKRHALGALEAGANTIRVKLPKRLGKGAYRFVLDASGGGRKARAYVRVNVA